MSTTRPTKKPRLTAFVSTETTGQDPFLHDAFEIAVILRHDGQDDEHSFRIKPDLLNADPHALVLSRYHERVTIPDWTWDDPHTAATRLHSLLDGAVMVGPQPAFDAEMLTHLLGRYYNQPRPWHYRTIDVVTLAAASLYGRASEWTRRDCDATWYSKVDKAVGWPWKPHDVARLVEVEPPAADARHTALGEARWARSVYDTVTVPDAFFAASDEQLAYMAGDALSRLHGGES